jgi:hypothetical protein
MPNFEHPIEVSTMSKIRYALFNRKGEQFFTNNPFATLELAWEFARIINVVRYGLATIQLEEGYEIRQLPEERRTENSTGARGKSDE